MADAAEMEIAGRAWDQATRGITGVDDALAALKPRFVEAITSGTPMAELEDDIMDQFAAADWNWPWFEDSYKMFGEWRMWPNVWPALRPVDDGTTYTPEDLAEYRKAAIAPLIIQSAAMIFFRDRHIGKAHPHQKWRLVHNGDAASMRAAEPYVQRIKEGDMSAMPPFFPGDKTRVGADNPLAPDADKRPEGGEPSAEGGGETPTATDGETPAT